MFLRIFEQARQRYRFLVVGYIVMPDHIHLLISEPERGELWPQAEQRVWQRRFYDFNVWSGRKRVEKLRYMHRNPLKCGLVFEPEQWAWSSYRSYALGEDGMVKINQRPKAVMKVRTLA